MNYFSITTFILVVISIGFCFCSNQLVDQNIRRGETIEFSMTINHFIVYMFMIADKSAPKVEITKVYPGVVGILVMIFVTIVNNILFEALNLVNGMCKVLRQIPIINYILFNRLCILLMGDGAIVSDLFSKMAKIPQQLAKPEDVDTDSWWERFFH